MKDDSYCKKDILCEFSKENEFYDALVEICVNCGKRVVYQKPIDQEKYALDHQRSTLQPSNPLFKRIYGTAGIKMGEKYEEYLKMKGKRESLREELKDKRISMRRRAFKGLGKSEKEIRNIPKRMRKMGL